MAKHIVIPDPHATPDWNNDRFEWFGRLVVAEKPDVVICIGDFADMPSLCSYDFGTKGYEGRRYKKDIESVIDAQERFFAPIKAAKKKLPRFVMLEGNHEHRIDRAISRDAAHLDGIISQDDLGYTEFGWEYVPYSGSTPGIVIIDGVAYSHFFTSGIMNRPIGGLHPAASLISKQFMSCTMGHTHTFDHSVRTRADGTMLHGMVCGVGSDEFMDFAGEANNLWWRGIHVKHDVHDGQYDLESISMDRLMETYA